MGGGDDAAGDFIEIFVARRFEECARRTRKGLYKKAMTGGGKLAILPAFPRPIRSRRALYFSSSLKPLEETAEDWPQFIDGTDE